MHPVLITTMEPLTAIISTLNHLPDFRLAEFCSDLLANKTHFSPQQGLGGCLLVVGLQGVVFIANFWISSSRRSCLVGVDVSCSGFMEAGSMRSPGLLHIANSIGVLPLRVTSVFLTVAALRISWAGVICDRVVSSRFLEAVSTCAERKLFNSRTPCGC